MYHEKMLSVCKIENGFLIEVRAPYKRKSKESKSDEPVECGMGYGEKEVYAKDATDLGQKIEALMPMLEGEFESETAFEDAFNEVAKK